jgi:hypothetical protein
MQLEACAMGSSLFALLIGIDDYGAYDRSAGLAPGTSDLRGAVNDVRLYWRTFQNLGIPPRNVRVLTTPRLDADDLGAPSAVTCGEASRAGIENGLDWLRDVVRHDRGARGIVTFCGHGDTDARGLLLCPSDVERGLSMAIPFNDVAARLDDRRPGTDITLFLDACHAAAGAVGSSDVRTRSLRGGASVGDAERRLKRAEDVVLAASGPDEPSYEYLLHGAWQGAFTWAVTSLLDRWGVSPNGSYFGLSYRELMQRARHVLANLAVEQRPVYAGPAEEAHNLVLGGRAAEPKAEKPQEGVMREVPPGMQGYILKNQSGTSIGYIDVTTSTIKWNWTSSSAAWPSYFTLTQAGTKPTSTPYVETTTHESFPWTSGSYSLSGVQYEIKQNGSIVGYMKRTSTALVWYKISSGSQFAVADMEFAPNSDTSTRTLYQVTDEFL